MTKLDLRGAHTMGLVVKALEYGKLVMHPTETCYGLAVDIFNEVALEKLYRVKKMPLNKPVSVLVSSLEMAQEYGEFSDTALGLAKRHWPGALSIVVPRKLSLPLFLNPDQAFVSLRFSSLEFCYQMVGAFGRPVTTTSANVSGDKESYLPIELEGVDLLVDGGGLKERKPSTIVKIEGSNIEILRQGDVFLT